MKVVKTEKKFNIIKITESRLRQIINEEIESYMMEWFWIALSLYPIWVIINLITPRLGLPCL